jgi:hypothetical protein
VEGTYQGLKRESVFTLFYFGEKSEKILALKLE